MNSLTRRNWWLLLLAASIVLLTCLAKVHADTIPADFNLQVTPTPLVTTVKPGMKSQLELRIHNEGTGTEALKIEPRAFTLSSNGSKVNLEDTTLPDIASWISFSEPKFTIAPGEWKSEEITLDVPKTAAFSYSFALVISRQNVPQPVGGTRSITGSLVVFTLINVDRPGATSSLRMIKLSVSKHLYEYLPATFSIQFRNTGNTIVQPFGNLFIQHSGNTQATLDTLTVNETKGYILPGTERTITTNWSDGFPVYQASQNPDGTASQKLVWNWAKLSQLRIGHYTAHLVAIYNQAGHDVPIEGAVSFWVIPWKILLVLLAVVLLVLFALFMIVRMIIHGIKRRHAKRAQKKAAKNQTPPTTSGNSTSD